MNAESRRVAYRFLVVGLLCWASAAMVYGTLRLSFGPRPVYIHVRWAPEVDDARRQRLEQRFGLSQREFREGRTWGYTLLDLSRDNVTALVGNAAVEDTHNIHRTAFRVGYFAPRRPYPPSRGGIPAGLQTLIVLLLLAGVAGIGLAFVERLVPGFTLGPIRALNAVLSDPRGVGLRLSVALVAWLRARIPSASAEAVALFRIVFGSALLLIVLREPLRAIWAARPANEMSAAQQLLLQVFVDVPWIVDWILPWVAFWGALFIVGAISRTAFAMLILGVFAWILLITTRTTYHKVTVLQLTLLCLLWSRWGDAWSVDAWWRRTKRGTPLEYGFTVWVPSLVLGVVFAAAAFAKMRDTGLAWILNGTVKYTFLADSRQALVDWGLQIAPYHGLAVLLSAGAIGIESCVIVAVLSGRYHYRLLAGLASMCLLTGFALFQGLFWPGWWTLLLSFLPWHLVKPPARAASGAANDEHSAPTSWRGLLQPAAIVVVIALIAQQMVVTLFRVEISPLISTYDMYSTTYSSPAEYEQKTSPSYWIVATDDSAGQHECQVGRREAEMVAGIVPATDRLSPAEVLRECFDASIRLRGVVVEARRPRVDWARWRFDEPARVQLTEPIPGP